MQTIAPNVCSVLYLNFTIALSCGSMNLHNENGSMVWLKTVERTVSVQSNQKQYFFKSFLCWWSFFRYKTRNITDRLITDRLQVDWWHQNHSPLSCDKYHKENPTTYLRQPNVQDFFEFIIIIIYILRTTSLFPQLVTESLAWARSSPHGVTSIPHIPRHRSRGDILRMLLLWKWHRLLRHPAICYWCLNSSKQAWVATMHVQLLRHLLLEPHLLHLLLNLGNLFVNNKEFKHNTKGTGTGTGTGMGTGMGTGTSLNKRFNEQHSGCAHVLL